MQVRINSYLRAVAPLGRESDHVGPFVATCTPTTDNQFLNYAIPEDDATPTADDVDALVAWFETRQRKPRLEYVTAEAPDVEGALITAGFVAEGRLPLMVWQADSSDQPPPPGIEVLVPVSDDDLFGMMQVTAEAYDSAHRPSRDEVHGLRSSLDYGTGAVIARDIATGNVVGGGTFAPIVNGITEVAAIGVAVSHRRRGIAQALARRLALEARARGAATPFLMAAHEDEARIYDRAGFHRVSEILHIAR